MSDTPRTDSSELPHALDDHHFVVGSFFARQLERELNAANQRIEMLTACNADVARIAKERNVALKRIQRLEEAGNQLKDRYILENENWDLKTVNDWNEAKEAKP